LEDEIRYRPISVRALLSELQTTTTLMIDLAYSSVLFNDKELAQEVIELEDKVEDLKMTLMMNTAIAIRDAEDAEEMVGILEIASVTDTISHSSASIARTVLLELGVNSSILKAFTRTQERIVRTKLLNTSVLAGKTLKELELETHIGISIIAVRRGRTLITNPGPELVLGEGDVLIAKGSDVGVLELDKLSRGELTTVPCPKLNVDGCEEE
jgi:uncharacterized protein with PhoU and TrkA domain